MTLYSRPDTIHLGGDLGMDSILVKGFTACEAYDAKWGTLPGDVAQEFDMKPLISISRMRQGWFL